MSYPQTRLLYGVSCARANVDERQVSMPAGIWGGTCMVHSGFRRSEDMFCALLCFFQVVVALRSPRSFSDWLHDTLAWDT